jgi:hypothetical protein
MKLMTKLGMTTMFLKAFERLPNSRHVSNVKIDGARNIPHLVKWKSVSSNCMSFMEVKKYNSNDQKPKQHTVNPRSFAAGFSFFDNAKAPTAKSIIAVIRY